MVNLDQFPGYSIINYIFFNLTYYGLAFTTTAIDKFGLVKKYQDYGIGETDNIFGKVYNRVFFNTYVASVPFIVLSTYYINWAGRESYLHGPLNYKILPSVGLLVTEIMILAVLSDLLFYTFHRIMHIPFLYKYHKMHHEIKKPIGLSSLYMGTVDLYFGNVLPSVLPFLMLSSPLSIVYIYVFLVLFGTIVIDHGGYDFGHPLCRVLDNHHELHHMYFKYNYGASPLFDKLFGTHMSRDTDTDTDTNIKSD